MGRAAGVAWHVHGFDLAVHDDGRIVEQVGFGPGEIDHLIDYVRRLDPVPPVVIDSSLGIVDGRMMAAGLVVHRADPDVLGPRPRLGSVPADRLAALGAATMGSLRRLERHRGTQTGIEDVLAGHIAASELATEDLIARGRCLRHGSRAERSVALTFDDGPQPGGTDAVLDVLARHHVPATFFCVGMHAAGRPDAVQRMADEGHAVGGHTWSHPFLWELDREQVVAQLERTAEAIVAAGAPDPDLFRPSYGSRTPEVMGWVADLGPTTVLWDVEPDDWAMPGPSEIATRVVSDVRPGSIVVMHDGGGDRTQTVAALPEVITRLRDEGYELVRVDAMVRDRP